MRGKGKYTRQERINKIKSTRGKRKRLEERGKRGKTVEVREERRGARRGVRCGRGREGW